jgi:CheY-like chemotaxis protein
MRSTFDILIAEDDEGHMTLIEKNLRRSGIKNPILHFKNGREVLDFLFGVGEKLERHKGYLLILDIRMPSVGGLDVLTKMKADEELRKIPVIMLTALSAPGEVERFHMMGCSNFVPKPVDYNEFEKAIEYLGKFLSIVQVPTIRRS